LNGTHGYQKWYFLWSTNDFLYLFLNIETKKWVKKSFRSKLKLKKNEGIDYEGIKKKIEGQ
jgi:hypothetical protein